ncbi:interleukin-18 receptor 1-like isoform X5 [Pristis pectinata]|uniref:interleukin-18 receptor 1-like isoform X5 n=1 Tax=Pristis pectinata TaxID=685728 RepID=UPI00223E6DFD|nr:interleukin-18 receptor 1-like isoform X5 [Pristis pectinata]
MVMDVKYLVLITFCYVVGRIQGSLTSKCFPYKSGLVFVTEGEHVRLTCNLYNAFTPLDMSNLQAHRLNISWFKHTSEGGHKKLLGEAGRITYEGTSLGFWPAFVNDTGNYTCSVFNRTYNVSSAGTSLNVHRNEGLCSDCFFSRTESVGKSIRLSCPKLKDYNSKEDNIIWMKDCKDKVHTGNAYTILKVEEKSAGYYSCVLTVGKDGVQYNVTRTIKLKTKGYVERFIPKLVYPGRKEQIEVELGKHDTSLIFLLLFTTLAVIIIVAVVYVRFKIDFVLCFRDLTSRDETLQDGKEYDAYVLLLKSNEALISAEGETFALKLLPAILEQKFGYRLCIYERDVLPGAASASEILSYINKSRTLIIILCAECMANDSSTYGLMTGLHQALVERLIKPILIEYLPIRDITLLPQSLQLILKSDRSVKWTNESLSQNSYFWKKIRYLMPAKYTKTAGWS